MPSQRVFIPNSRGEQLAAITELPAETPIFYGLFSHCFTCSKDLKAIVRISRKLAEYGIAIVRFDFTGLGDSSGDFSASNFETNLDDVMSVVDWMQQHAQSPQMLLGLSLGGAAMMVAASKIDSVRGLVTLAAPSCTKHLAEFLSRENPEIESRGSGTVTIGGRSHVITPQLLASLRERNLDDDLRRIQVHHLIFHSPDDETLAYSHAEKIFQLSGGIRSMVTLDGADHLMMNQPTDVDFVAEQIQLWSRRWRS